jgi:hypothetical protein
VLERQVGMTPGSRLPIGNREHDFKSLTEQ